MNTTAMMKLHYNRSSKCSSNKFSHALSLFFVVWSITILFFLSFFCSFVFSFFHSIFHSSFLFFYIIFLPLFSFFFSLFLFSFFCLVIRTPASISSVFFVFTKFLLHNHSNHLFKPPPQTTSSNRLCLFLPLNFTTLMRSLNSHHFTTLGNLNNCVSG